MNFYKCETKHLELLFLCVLPLNLIKYGDTFSDLFWTGLAACHFLLWLNTARRVYLIEQVAEDMPADGLSISERNPAQNYIFCALVPSSTGMKQIFPGQVK